MTKQSSLTKRPKQSASADIVMQAINLLQWPQPGRAETCAKSLVKNTKSPEFFADVAGLIWLVEGLEDAIIREAGTDSGKSLAQAKRELLAEADRNPNGVLRGVRLARNQGRVPAPKRPATRSSTLWALQGDTARGALPRSLWNVIGQQYG